MTSRRSAAALAATVLAGCAAGSGGPAALPPLGTVPSGVVLSTHVMEYEVAGATVADLRREMVRNGPTAQGVRYAGATHWNIRWTYKYDRGSSGCALRDVRAFVDATVELPRWTPETTPDSAEVRWWEGFRERLAAHEQGHVRLAADAAGTIVDSLRSLSGGTCDALSMRANTVGQNLLMDANNRQAAFDRDTRHGALPAKPGTATH